jgi:ABC-2 type transport system permease protein
MTTVAPPAPRVAAVRAFVALLERDLHVLTSEKGTFFVQTVSQPLLLVYVFTYVFPTIGQGFEASGGQSFTDVLVPGVLAITVLIKAIQSVALPLVREFGYTREIEDRVMAPLPIWAVAVEKIVSGAAQGLLAAVIVAPIALVVPAEPVSLQVNWPALIGVAILAPLASSALGLVLGTSIEPNQVPLMFSIVILPVTFLGATYYPWSALAAIPWLQVATLANPLVYIAEGFRFALTPQLGTMPPTAIFGALAAATLLLGWLAVRGFRRRVVG